MPWCDDLLLEIGLREAGYGVLRTSESELVRKMLKNGELPLVIIFSEDNFLNHLFVHSGEFILKVKELGVRTIMMVNKPCYLPKLIEKGRASGVDAVIARPVLFYDILGVLKRLTK